MRLGRTMMAALAAGVGLGLVAPAPVGAAVPPPAKAIAITAAPTSTVWSQSTKLTVAITPKGGGVPRGGTVTFLDGDVPLGTATATARNTTFTTAALTPGEHQLVASYSGDSAIAPGSSAPITVTVAKAPTSVVLTSDGPVAPGERPTLKAVVRPVGPAAVSQRPTGKVAFTVGSSTARVNVNANGVATWRPTLPEGTHEITATYEGSDLHGPSTSSAITQEVVAEPAHILDQQSFDEFYGASNVYGGEQWFSSAQTFVAGITGQLDQVTLRLWQNDEPTTLTVEIRTLSEGVPTSTVLGSGTVEWTEVPVWDTSYYDAEIQPSFDVELDVPAAVSAGTEYAIVLTSETTFGQWLPGVVEADSPGLLLEQAGSSTWWLQNQYDMWFRTWVIPAPG